MSNWVRLWEDMPDDPKWRVIAKRSGRPLHEVIAVFTRMLVNAGRSSVRGSLEGWDDEDEATALDMDETNVQSIRNAMQGKVLEGNSLTGWEKRQPKREDNSTGRVQAFRERRNETKRDETHRNAPEEKRVDTDVRDANASLVDGEPPTADVLPLEKPNPEKKEALRQIGEWWNQTGPVLGLPAIDAIKAGSTRERHAWARAREMRADYGSVCNALSVLDAKIRGSPFLQGKRKWKGVTFDWLMEASNYQKVIEGNYDEVRQA